MKLILLLPLLLFIACVPQSVDFRATDLRSEYLNDPTGIETTTPRLSWKISSSRNGVVQSAYHIQVATCDSLLQKDKPDLWDSGMTRSDHSAQVVYQGKPIEAGKKVFWRVQIRNGDHFTSPWSAIASWEMALTNNALWKASWIGSPDANDIHNPKMPSPLFRKVMEISGKVKKARAYISGLGYYELYVNGQRISDHVLSPNQTNYDKQQLEQWNEKRIGNMTSTVLYETHDITGQLKLGTNAIGVILGNGWYFQADRPSDNMLWYNTPRLIAQIQVEYTDGKTQLLTSDESWKCAPGPILYNGLHTGEIYDARKEQKGWNEPQFDASGWKNAERVNPPTGKMMSQISPPDRVTRTILPVSVTERTKGVYRYDLGEMISGWVQLTVTGKQGTEVQLRYMEEAGPGYTQTDTYILKGEGTERWEPRFTWHAFRYIEVSGSDIAMSAIHLEGKVVNTDIQPAGSFECSNPLFNKILDNYRRTQLGNVHGGIPSDCPHRERRGYTGDGQISAEAAIYNFDMAQFYTKWLNDMRDAQNHVTGYMPNTVPYQDGAGGTAWGSACVIIPWYMYLFYDDTRILTDNYEMMKHWIAFMKDNLNHEGILANQGLGEWVPPEKVRIPADFVNSCYYYHCCNLMQKIANVLDKDIDELHFRKLKDEAENAINTIWLDGKSGNYANGDQGANLFPLGFGLVPKRYQEKLFGNVLQNTIIANKAHFDTGILATPLLLEVLTEMGRTDVAYTIMNQHDFPGFGFMIERGASTIWETWLGDASHSHPMFGSVCAWFYKRLAGIAPDPAKPGFKNILIKPYPVSALSYVKCSYPSTYGTIRSDWKFSGNDYLLEVTVPANSAATVSVLGDNPSNIVVNSGKKDAGKFVTFIGSEGSNVNYSVASGRYSFLSKGALKMLRKTILPAPVIHPADTLTKSGTTVMVTIASDVPQSQIFYTLNGTEPDSLALRYTAPFPVTKDAVLKARAMKKGFEPSFPAVSRLEFYNKDINGLTAAFFTGAWQKLPDFSQLKVVRKDIFQRISLDGVLPPADLFAMQLGGNIRIDKAGSYTFYLLSNDGSRLAIGDKVVIDNDGQHGADTEVSGTVDLTIGMHPLRLDYFQAGGGMYLDLKYAGPEIEKQHLPASVLFIRK